MSIASSSSVRKLAGDVEAFLEVREVALRFQDESLAPPSAKCWPGADRQERYRGSFPSQRRHIARDAAVLRALDAERGIGGDGGVV